MKCGMLRNMRRKKRTILNFILTGSLLAGCVGSCTNLTMVARASTVSEIEGQINQHTNQLNSINKQIVALESEQDIIQEQIDDLNAEITNMMAAIGLKEDEIAEKEEEISKKEEEIARKEEEIAQKKLQIEQTEAEYKAAMEREASQRENMAICARMIYERGEDSFLSTILEGKGISDILNLMDQEEKVHEYENSMLLGYIEVKNQVHELWLKLEDEKARLEEDRKQLETDRQQLEADRQQLEADKEELRGQKASLDSMLAKKKIAQYALQYVGNPYVSGGTSLTNGADCSGFIYRVFSDFGYSVSRTSYQQRSNGTAVNYSDAQPGDIICYEGHVGLYIGDGLIVHASNSNPYPSGGIKVSQAQYRTILGVRRIVK